MKKIEDPNDQMNIGTRKVSPIWMNDTTDASTKDDHGQILLQGKEGDQGCGFDKIKKSPLGNNHNSPDLDIQKGNLINESNSIRDQRDPIIKNLKGDEAEKEEADYEFGIQLLGRFKADINFTMIKEDGTPLSEREYPVNIITREKRSLDGYIVGLKNNNEDEIIWAMVRGEPILDENCEVEKIALYSMDITDLKNNQIYLDKKRVELENKVGKITNELEIVKDSAYHVNNYDMKIQLLTNTGSFEYEPGTGAFKGSKMCNKILGLDENEEIDLEKLLRLMSDRERDSVEAMIDETMKDGESKLIEVSYQIGDESKSILIKLISHRSPVNDDDMIVGIVQDISKERSTRVQLDKMSSEIDHINKIMIDRESRVIEIKQEVNELCKELGREPKYQNI